MTDISKCNGTSDLGTCPMRETCYRYTAPDNGRRQSYMAAPLYQLSDGGELKCDEYWRVK